MASKRTIVQKKSHSFFIGLALCSLLMMSCGLPASIFPNAATPVPPGPTPRVGLASPTSISPNPTMQVLLESPTTILPTSTPEIPTDTPTSIPPSPTPLGTATPVIPVGTFALAPGTTAGVLTGTIQPGQTVTYTMGAGQSQPLILIADSKHRDVTLGVSEQNGNVLLDPSLRRTAWQMALPSTELYTIELIGGAATEDYSLTVKLPQMVSFASGATSATLSGSTISGNLYSYSLNCSAGQTMTASLNVPSSTAYLDIYGISTGTLLSASAGTNTWTGILPMTQAYVIEVVPTNGQVVGYSLTVSITASANAANITGNIVLAPGTTAAVLYGTIQPGQVLTYTAQAWKNQPLILMAESPNFDVTLGVLKPDGSVLLDSAKKWAYWQAQLPTTGQYTIQVIGGKITEKYTLTVKLAQLVYLPSGHPSVTLHGNTYPGYVVSYAFRLGAGSHLTVSLSAPSGEAIIDIFGIQTGSLLSYKDGATFWTGTLPETEEYVVEVVPRHGASLVYTLTVSIP